MKGWKHIAAVTSLIVSTSVLALATATGGLGYTLPAPQVRDLAYWYLITVLNPSSKLFTAMSPEAVTSIVWDYRGLDTFFETSVFFLAIIGSISLMRGLKIVPQELKNYSLGMSPIVKTVTKITAGMIIAVAASIALHGHLTPGGGFQGGATAAVAPLLVMVVFSIYFIIKLGITEERMLALRTAGLVGIVLTAFAVCIIAASIGMQAYIFQNQPKNTAPIGLPASIMGSLTSGTLILFNLFEFLAVAAGFTIVFLLLSIPEEIVKKALRGGESEH